MINSTLAFSALETNEIFESTQKSQVLEKICKSFGSPTVFSRKTGYTTLDGRSKTISEDKWIWEITNPTTFLEFLDDNHIAQDLKQVFHNTIQRTYMVGLYSKDLPYFQLMIYAQLSFETDVNIISQTTKLAIPFQTYLQNLDGFSPKVYKRSEIPRCHMHHVIYSEDYFSKSLRIIDELRSQQSNTQQEPHVTPYTTYLRQLPILRDLPYPTILSSVNVHLNVLSFITHYEQLGDGGELQTCGMTLTNDPKQILIMSSKQQVADNINMFAPNLDIFDSVAGAISLHLFFSGLITWLMYFEDIREGLSEKLENEREQIQNLLNENNMNKTTHLHDRIAKFQGHLATMGLLLSNVRNQIIVPVVELYSRNNSLGVYQIPIPQRINDPFSHFFNQRVENQVYFKHIGKRIKNDLDTIAEKLSSVENPTNRMNNFLYNQTNLELQNRIKLNSKINIVLSIVIGIFAGISIYLSIFHT